MKEFFKSTKIKIFLSVLLVLIMLSVFTRNVQNNVVSTTVNAVTYGLSKVTAAAVEDKSEKSYDELKEENELLSQANRELRAKLIDYHSVKEENTRLWKFYGLKKQNEDFSLIPATVLRRDSNDEFGSFTIDKGTSSDISTGDPVIGENGLVGWISEADVYTAKVVTVLSPQTSIGAVDKATGDTGIITGSSKYADDNRTMFSKLDSDNKVEEGDIISSSGSAGIYPKGLVLGEVKEIGYDTYDTSHYAVIEPYDDISKIVDVAVISDYEGQGEILVKE
ncbi:MAG: rod shape-determining protein MreC [Ruminococcus sp.]|jgi:rod shape-determining protein MreC|nr:rod shape-determining protein MreC [Ruminococcus sp.]MBQ9472097.1 rod shape-determining protein MreC [Ruminococcus sp.]